MNTSKSNRPAFKNAHLLVSIVVIIPIALAYGSSPTVILPKLFAINADNVNLAHIFRAMMGLYLAMAALWIAGIVKPKYWGTATITNIFFMGGLALGRLVSLAVDGPPSVYLLTGLAAEATLAVWGLLNLKKYNRG